MEADSLLEGLTGAQAAAVTSDRIDGLGRRDDLHERVLRVLPERELVQPGPANALRHDDSSESDDGTGDPFSIGAG